jgi:hypothetical protein
VVKELIFDQRTLGSNLLENVLFEGRMKGHNTQKAIAIMVVTSTTIAYMSDTGVVKADVGDVVMKAFNPLISALQGLSEPVCFLVILSGGLIFAFDRNKGLKLIKQGATAYLLIQFLPSLLGILKQVGKGMASAR